MHRRAFTLMELLIVIAIIVVLMAIAVTVGASVVSGGRATQTKHTIQALDTMLNDLMQQDGGLPSPLIDDWRDPAKKIPIADARNLSGPSNQIINSVGLFLRQAGVTASSADSIKGIDSKLIKLYTPYATAEADGAGVVPEITTVMDGWGRPIRYVHPQFHGRLYGPDALDPDDPVTGLAVSDVMRDTTTSFTITTIRRNDLKTVDPAVNPGDEADSDGGYCTNNTPYFYSVGPDGDPSKRKDNVYTNEPKFIGN